jgi:hypothetical protein
MTTLPHLQSPFLSLGPKHRHVCRQCLISSIPAGQHEPAGFGAPVNNRSCSPHGLGGRKLRGGDRSCDWCHNDYVSQGQLRGVGTWPAPPLASMVTGATKRVILPLAWSNTSTPRHLPLPPTCRPSFPRELVLHINSKMKCRFPIRFDRWVPVSQ